MTSPGATSSSHASNGTPYQSISYQDQVRSTVQDKFAYLNNIFCNQSELVQKFEWENHQLKIMLSVLLHFKHCFLFITKDVNFHNLTTVTEDLMLNDNGNSSFKKSKLSYEEAMLLKTDLDHCFAKYATVLKSSNCFDFVAQKENLYYQSNSRYRPYKEDISELIRPDTSNSMSSLSRKNMPNHGIQPILRNVFCNNINNSDVRSTISSSSSIEVLDNMVSSLGPSGSRQQINNSSTTLSFHNVEPNSDNNNNTSKTNHHNSRNSVNHSFENDQHHQDRVAFEEDESLRYQSEPTTYLNQQMEVSLNEEDIYFSCSMPNCSFKSKSWTQVTAHEFRRHK